jgi:hypothetical protein
LTQSDIVADGQNRKRLREKSINGLNCKLIISAKLVLLLVWVFMRVRGRPSHGGDQKQFDIAKAKNDAPRLVRRANQNTR